MSMPMPMANNTMNDTSMMQMTFFWGKHVVLLFKDWPNGKLDMYILALVIAFVVAVAVEFLASFPAIKTRASLIRPGYEGGLGGLKVSCFSCPRPTSFFVFSETALSPIISVSAQATVYGLRMALAYLIMLSVMSYNIGAFISAVVEHAFGYFLVKYRATLKAKNDLV
ncbi:copper transporter 6-like [Bidens hawaiensis]|uniref:copper transporter 6-like n=1 Tax=Bidens hawaiensis TaxID=980011 RepID=UPI00404B1158